MGDLSQLDKSEGTKIAISDSTGAELVWARGTQDGFPYSASIFDTGIICNNIVVGTTAVEAKAGASVLQYRKGISIFYNGTAGNKLYYGCSGVTTLKGIQVFKNTEIFVPAGENCHVYLIADLAGQDVRIVEWA